MIHNTVVQFSSFQNRPSIIFCIWPFSITVYSTALMSCVTSELFPWSTAFAHTLSYICFLLLQKKKPQPTNQSKLCYTNPFPTMFQIPSVHTNHWIYTTKYKILSAMRQALAVYIAIDTMIQQIFILVLALLISVTNAQAEVWVILQAICET